MSNKPPGIGKQIENDIFSIFDFAYGAVSGRDCVYCGNTGYMKDADTQIVRTCPKGCKPPAGQLPR